VTFYSDIDSISFTIQPNTYYDFVIVVEGKDSCLTRVESGIKFLAEELQNQTPDTIPFTLTPYNNISIEAVINGQDTAKLMFHTAANSVGLTNETVKRFKDFKIDEKGEGNAIKFRLEI
jgi:hypothetical protein